MQTPMQTSRVVGVDIGGSNLRLGWVEDGEVVGELRTQVGNRRSPQAICRIIQELLEQGRQAWGAPHAIGIGAPGIVDQRRGRVMRSPHYPEWVDFALAWELERRLASPVIVDNDANMVALGEARYGAGIDLPNFIMLTFGTGIGGGIIINGQPFRGDYGGGGGSTSGSPGGSAGEVGHMTIDEAGPPCPCGGRGCWELFASGTGMHRLIDTIDNPHRQGFLRHFNGESARATPEAVFQRAKEGDLFASLLWRKFGYYVGVGIASLTNIMGLHHYVIGGGLASAWEFFIDEVPRGIKRHTYPETARTIQLHRAARGDHAGILGAAHLAGPLAEHLAEHAVKRES